MNVRFRHDKRFNRGRGFLESMSLAAARLTGSLCCDAMNQLKRDVACFLIARRAVEGCFIGLGLLKGLQFYLGLKEHEFYKQYPISWYVAVACGLGFIVSLVYSVKKAYDMHPNIQLRSKSNEILEGVLADPDYKHWHQEAKRLLDERKT